MVNQAKPHSVEEFKADAGKNKNKHTEAGTLNGVSDKNKASEESRNSRNSLYVKVNMDGVLIGRKVNLSAHSSYETLAQTVENMFLDPTALVDSTGNFFLTSVISCVEVDFLVSISEIEYLPLNKM